jgi:hypothetical protein
MCISYESARIVRTVEWHISNNYQMMSNLKSKPVIIGFSADYTSSDNFFLKAAVRLCNDILGTYLMLNNNNNTSILKHYIIEKAC